jgi:hypothetical protein
MPLRSLQVIFVIFYFNFTDVPAQTQDSLKYENLDSVITDLYEVISGPSGERNWKLFRSLFHDNATMGAIRLTSENKREFVYFTPEEYIKRNDPFFKTNHFYEKELGRKVNRFGGIAQVFTAYEYRLNYNQKIRVRGVNCIQLVFEKGRWYINNIIWEEENTNNKIPAEMINN